MAQLNLETVKAKVIDILPYVDPETMDKQLDIIVAGAISKLRREGVPINAKCLDGSPYFTDGTGENEDITSMNGNDYVICVGYQVLKDMDTTDNDMNYLTEQYITRVNEIRCSLPKQN